MAASEKHLDPRAFKVPQVRDLAFMLCTEGPLQGGDARPLKILSSIEHSEVLKLCQELDTLPVEQWLGEQPTGFYPLGRYAEALSNTWLARSSHYHVVAQHEQIRDGVDTLGELDYLVIGANNQREHWEASINFFCIAANPPHMGLGPNLKDTLDEKCERVFQRQLPLSSHAVCVARYGTGWQPRALFQGWLFQEISAKNALPAWANPRANLGYWTLDLAAIAELGEKYSVRNWMVMEKARWIAPCFAGDIPEYAERLATDPAQALSRFKPEGKDAPLLVGLGEDGWERVRCFFLSK